MFSIIILIYKVYDYYMISIIWKMFYYNSRCRTWLKLVKFILQNLYIENSQKIRIVLSNSAWNSTIWNLYFENNIGNYPGVTFII